MKQILIHRLSLIALVTIFTCGFLITPQIFSQTAAAQTEANKYFNKVRADKKELREFIHRLPKGGELHTHLSGTPTPERLLELAEMSKLFKYFVRIPAQYVPDDPAAYQLVAVPPGQRLDRESSENLVPVSVLLKPANDQQRAQREAYRRANIINDGETTPLDIFYGAIFHRRGNVVNSSEMVPLLIADAVRQAHRDHLSYIELQLTPFPIEPLQNIGEVNRVINVTDAREYMTRLIESARAANAQLPEPERVEVRFILAFSRTSAKVFLYLPIAFEMAAGNDEIAQAIAGLNIVGNEYSQDQRIGQVIAGPEHLRDYIQTLHRIYPNVRLSLHAGEGTKWDWHIRDSVLMGAERIGHATNLSLSPDAVEPELLRRERVLVEACLTSNHLLLGVPFAQHPFLNYLRAGIPVSLNSDDAGIFSTDMTEEFIRAVENHPEMTWAELKQLARNSLEHAFVNEKDRQRLIANWEAEIQKLEATMK